MININPGLLADAYKYSHKPMYPEGTTKVVANFTPRSGKWAPEGINYVVPWGVRLIPYLITRYFNDNFFYPHTNDLYYTIHNMKTNTLSSSQSSALQNTHAIRKRQQALDGLKITLSDYTNGDIDFSHFEELQKHGELPIKWKVLESTRPVPFGTPVLTIENTVPEFYWVPNFLETIISNLLWKPMTSATIASAYYKLLSKYAFLTTGKTDFVKYQAHDFSFRGMDSPTAAVLSGLGHCLFFNSSDTIPVAQFIRQNYPLGERGLFKIVPATEHSVMCAGTQEGEGETFDRLMKIYPKGLLSVVSDTWDLWKVITEIIASRKDKIMARDGKLVIRPDSGDPVDIICGTDIETSMDTDRSHLSPEEKGVVELLWDIFGGSVTKQGFKVLHDCIGTIYGDSITLKRAEDICERLARKGFASINVVFGIGSYTYQYNTRDTFGFAIKATYCEVNNEPRDIFKDPITDGGTKKSIKGLPMVLGTEMPQEITVLDQVTYDEFDKDPENLLKTVGPSIGLRNFWELQKDARNNLFWYIKNKPDPKGVSLRYFNQ